LPLDGGVKCRQPARAEDGSAVDGPAMRMASIISSTSMAFIHAASTELKIQDRAFQHFMERLSGDIKK